MSEPNVVSLSGGHPTGVRKPNQHVIAALEDWTARAQAGEVIGIVIAGVTHDYCGINSEAGYLESYALLGSLTAVHHSIMERHK